MEETISVVQAFLVARAFLEKQYFDHYSDDLACCAGDLMLNRSKKNWEEEPETWDPAVWEDWEDAAKSVTGELNFSIKNTRLLPLDAYRVMQKYIYDYANRLNSSELTDLAKRLDEKRYQIFSASCEWKDWLLCLNALLTNKTQPDGSLLGIDSQITERQALEIMQEFIRDYLLKHNDQIDNLGWIKRVLDFSLDNLHNDVLLIDWRESYRFYLEDSDRLGINILQGFNVMRNFIQKQYEQTGNKHFEPFLSALAVKQETQTPVKYPIFYAWMHAAYAIIYKEI
jgi:hypothetical protein